MPTTYTHYRFGKDVLSALPRPIKTAVENNRELFDIGLHGPDILFYYQALKPNPVSAQGYGLHGKMADVFFQNAKKVIAESEDPAASRAYAYGVICHFALDSECHPYVEKMIQASGISHSEIEMEMDRYLLVEDGIRPVSYLGTKHIHPTLENAKIIAPFFEDLSAETVQKSLKSMIFCHRILLAPNPVKRKVIFAGMFLVGKYESLHGMVMSEEPNEKCREYCLLLKKLYAGAVPLAADLIMKYQKTLLQNAALPERFHRTFGAGENWDELPL